MGRHGNSLIADNLFPPLYASLRLPLCSLTFFLRYRLLSAACRASVGIQQAIAALLTSSQRQRKSILSIVTIAIIR
ncbi:hypothetical protein RJ55_00228 [Drechmeria coniospora]|nr:hypothetical protein RJ55_00228 [Drechmeria coniospora]